MSIPAGKEAGRRVPLAKVQQKNKIFPCGFWSSAFNNSFTTYGTCNIMHLCCSIAASAAAFCGAGLSSGAAQRAADRGAACTDARDYHGSPYIGTGVTVVSRRVLRVCTCSVHATAHMEHAALALCLTLHTVSPYGARTSMTVSISTVQHRAAAALSMS